MIHDDLDQRLEDAEGQRISSGPDLTCPDELQGATTVNDYPAMIAPAGHVEPVPRRIRAYLAGEPVLDTARG